MTLTDRVRAWRDQGRHDEFRGHRIHYRVSEGEGPLVLYMHGFPSSSYDWRHLLEIESDRASLAFDFLGFGLSDKPRDHSYVLAWQADLAEELARRHGGGRPVFICAHDLGTSVATEMLARDLAGELEIELVGALLFNGSMIIDRSHPTFAQRMLKSRIGPLASRLTNERLFRHQFGSIFSPSHPLTEDEEADQWSLILHNDGTRIGHKLVGYMEERVIYADRWHGALGQWEKPLALTWGMLDPVATPQVLEDLIRLRPDVPLTTLDDIGHYPQLEDPERLAGVLRSAIDSV